MDEQFYAIITDLVGTPAELVDADGDIAWQSNPTLWGIHAISRLASADCPLRFPGQYFDSETQTGLNYFRYYDPVASRYQTGDPADLELSGGARRGSGRPRSRCGGGDGGRPGPRPGARSCPRAR